MKKFTYVLWFLAIILNLHGQPLQAHYKKGLPAFDIIQTDGSHFRASDLKKDLPVMIVYFDPDCDHCETFIRELMVRSKDFTDVQLLLITYVPIQTVKKFVSGTGLDKFPGIKVDTEGTAFIVRYHYNVLQFPYLALHDRDGNLFATYESEVPGVKELAGLFVRK